MENENKYEIKKLSSFNNWVKKLKDVKATDFDISEYLDNDEIIKEYITQVLDDGDINEILEAIGNIAKAKGITEVAEKSGLSRTSLYKVFEKNAKPRFETVLKVLHSFNIKLKAASA